jgi:DNA mismatch repair protein MutS2
VAVTTHYERLKELAADDPRFMNASVGFDFERMQPTFALTLGVPGASSALAVASRHGLPSEVVARARGLMSAPSVQREELLARLQREHEAAAQITARAREDADTTAALRKELEEQRSEVRQKERKKLERERDEMVMEVRNARAELRTLLAAAKSGDGDALRRAERAVDEAARTVAAGAPIDRMTRDVPAQRATAPALAVGVKVWVERLGSVAEIVEGPDRGHVRVQAGAFALRVPIEELRLPDAAERRSQRRDRPHPVPPRAPVRVPPIRTSHNTCDLRGQRVDDALMELDRFIDELSRNAPEDPGFALHGHGTGALKRAIRDHLSASQRVVDVRPAEQDEGGDAFTVFWLR